MYLDHKTIENNTQNSTAKKQYSNTRKTRAHTEMPTSTQFYTKPRKTLTTAQMFCRSGTWKNRDSNYGCFNVYSIQAFLTSA